MNYKGAVETFRKYGKWYSHDWGTYDVGSNRKKHYIRELRDDLKRMVRKEKKRLGFTKLATVEYRRLRNFAGVNSYK